MLFGRLRFLCRAACVCCPCGVMKAPWGVLPVEQARADCRHLNLGRKERNQERTHFRNNKNLSLRIFFFSSRDTMGGNRPGLSGLAYTLLKDIMECRESYAGNHFHRPLLIWKFSCTSTSFEARCCFCMCKWRPDNDAPFGV